MEYIGANDAHKYVMTSCYESHASITETRIFHIFATMNGHLELLWCDKTADAEAPSPKGVLNPTAAGNEPEESGYSCLFLMASVITHLILVFES